MMLLLNPWRLSLLFLISGVALRFAVDKASSIFGFTGKRFMRLFVPLLFGVVVIVTPQAYFELLGKAEIAPGYMDFYVRYLSSERGFSIIVPTWNHLWYVVYMLVYTMLIIPLMPLVRKLGARMDTPRFERLMANGRLFIIPALLFIGYRFTTDTWYPQETHAFVGDWGAHFRYFSYFLIGLVVAKNQAFWRVLAATWRIGAVAALLLALTLSLLWANWDDWFGGITAIETLVRAMRPLYAWVVIAALLGAGQHYLNKPSARLSYLTTAIFPYYILHQTIIVVAGVWLSGFNLPVVAEFAALVMFTFGGCYGLYELVIRRVGFLKPLFGVPRKN